MATELLKAAIEGNEQVLTEMLRLEQDHSNQTAVSIESSTDGESHNHLQSATFMGNTVLHILCSYGHDVLSSKVCKKDGSLLRARNKMLETPLHCAAKAGEGEIIIKLIEFARTKGESELREVLRSKNKNGETALHKAARHNHKGIIDELLKVDQELVYEVDCDDNCALHVAIDRGDRAVVASMIGRLHDQKIDPRIYCSRPKRTTSHSNGREREGRTERPIDEMSNSADIFTNSPIHRAVLVGNTDVAELLLENDDSLAYLQYEGVFPIHVAARKGHLKMVLLFLERYLDSTELLDHHGRNFLHIAAEENNSSVFMMQGWIEKYLENKGAKFTPVWVQAFMPRIDGEGSMTDQIQIVGFGAVLITTVTFAAAFTLPGGNDSNGLPVMGGNAAVVDILPNNELKAIDDEVDRNPIPIEMRRPTCSARMKFLLRVLPPICGIFLFSLIP
ncbi:hypothetical protein LUZ60_010709 [Juncus effusus]|nr:hypothetical protein LUZ60_010709 [Juncus effusus]